MYLFLASVTHNQSWRQPPVVNLEYVKMAAIAAVQVLVSERDSDDIVQWIHHILGEGRLFPPYMFREVDQAYRRRKVRKFSFCEGSDYVLMSSRSSGIPSVAHDISDILSLYITTSI